MGPGGPARFFELRRRDQKKMCYYVRPLTEEEEIKALRSRDYLEREKGGRDERSK